MITHRFTNGSKERKEEKQSRDGSVVGWEVYREREQKDEQKQKKFKRRSCRGEKDTRSADQKQGSQNKNSSHFVQITRHLLPSPPQKVPFSSRRRRLKRNLALIHCRELFSFPSLFFSTGRQAQSLYYCNYSTNRLITGPAVLPLLPRFTRAA